MMSYPCENEAEDIQNGDGYVAQGDAKCKKSSTRQWTMPTRLTLKNSGLSVIYPMPTGRPVAGPNPPQLPTHQSTQWTLNNGAPVSDNGREN